MLRSIIVPLAFLAFAILPRLEAQSSCDSTSMDPNPTSVFAGNCNGSMPIPPFEDANQVSRFCYVAAPFVPNCVEDYRLFFPPTGVKPPNGWPVLIHFDLSGFNKTVDFQCLDSTAEGDATALDQRRLAKILESGFAVVTARATPSLPASIATWNGLCPGTAPTVVLGNGLFHPPGAQSTIGGVLQQPYLLFDYATAERDAVMIIQHVRYYADDLEVMHAPATVEEALTLLDHENIFVDGASAGATALMWAALGPDRSTEEPFDGEGGQHEVDSRPKAAILRNGLIWWPLMAECDPDLIEHNTPHVGCDESGLCSSGCVPCEETACVFGSSATTGAQCLRDADSEEVFKSAALWYSDGSLPVYMRYEQDFVCKDYIRNPPCSPATPGPCSPPAYVPPPYPFCFTDQGLEDKVHPTWSGYTWKTEYPNTTRLIVAGSAAYEKKVGLDNTVPDVIGLLMKSPESPAAADEDRVTTDQILWLRKLLGTPLTTQEAWIRLNWGPNGTNPAPVATSGSSGMPNLTATGTCIPPQSPTSVGSPFVIRVTQAPPNAWGILYTSQQQLLVPFKGGYFVPEPDFEIAFMTNGSGGWSTSGTWPDLAAGTTIFYQAWITDTGIPQGAVGTNGLMSITQPPIPPP
jgi:hypothetical protein